MDDSRQPVAIRVARPYASEDEFLENELDTLTRTSVVLVGAQSRPQGVVLRFEITLASGAPLMRGEGRVVAYKANAHGDEPGLSLRFTRLDPRSKALVDRAAALRDARAKNGGRGSQASMPRVEAPAPSSANAVAIANDSSPSIKVPSKPVPKARESRPLPPPKRPSAHPPAPPAPPSRGFTKEAASSTMSYDANTFARLKENQRRPPSVPAPARDDSQRPSTSPASPPPATEEFNGESTLDEEGERPSPQADDSATMLSDQAPPTAQRAASEIPPMVTSDTIDVDVDVDLDVHVEEQVPESDPAAAAARQSAASFETTDVFRTFEATTATSDVPDEAPVAHAASPAPPPPEPTPAPARAAPAKAAPAPAATAAPPIARSELLERLRTRARALPTDRVEAILTKRARG